MKKTYEDFMEHSGKPCHSETNREYLSSSGSFLLVALNAKYIHSNLGLLSIRAYAKKHGMGTVLAEYTINHRMDVILRDIYERKPKVIAFSCYIWNISMICGLALELHKIMPQVPIWLGGPEVSYEAEEQLKKYKWCKGIILGEGEETVTELAYFYRTGNGIWERKRKLTDIAGIVFREEADGFGEEVVVRTSPRPLLSMDDIPFACEDLKEFSHRIIYYETSRGCPFGCSYCLSSVDRKVRFRSMHLVKKELQFFLDNKVPQVKFVDRTFNCNPKHTMEIWRYLYEHDNGVTNFHFEIAADLLSEEELAYIKKFRPGLVQLEIGVQSTNNATIAAINRKQDTGHLKEVVAKIREGHNIHQHLDLIAGLPFEDFTSFCRSFNDVYDMHPDQLQLGFLKMLKGSPIYFEKEEHNIIYKENAPYEVLCTQWLSYADIIRLKRVEDMVEVYYNSGQFQTAMRYLEALHESPFALYDGLGEYYREQGLEYQSHTRYRRYEILIEYCSSLPGCDDNLLKEFLIYDLYSRENLKNRPKWAKEPIDKAQRHAFYDDEENRRKYFGAYEGYKPGQIAGMTHVERFMIDIYAYYTKGIKIWRQNDILFDYKERSPLNHQAKTVEVVVGGKRL